MDNPDAQLLNELERLLQLSTNVRPLVNEVVAAGSRLRQVNPPGLDIRDRVLIGLAIKAYNCFECLSQDAANLRSEAFHHLKTLAETYIYFQWAGINTIDSRAKLLLAKGCREKNRIF